MAYATLQQIRRLGVMRPSDIDRIEAQEPGITMERAATVESLLNSKLQKRYRAPFDTVAPPLSLTKYVAVTTTYELLMDVRGLNPSSDQKDAAEKALERVEAWLTNAVDGEKGDAELRALESGLGSAAVNAGGPIGYSEPDPYSWQYKQMERLDALGRGRR